MDSATLRKAVTLQDVASAVGVAKSTASYAFTGNRRISDETREAVLQAAQRMGFEVNFHAQQLSNGTPQRSVGLFAIDLNLGVSVLKIRKIQSLLTEAGYEVPLYSYGSPDLGDARSHSALMHSVRRQKPLAIVCCTSNLDDMCIAELERYRDDGGIVVGYDDPVDFECDHVVFDREENTYQAAHYLVQRGHRDIGFCAPIAETERFGGFASALQEAGISPRPEWLSSNALPYDQSGVEFVPLEQRGAELAQWFLDLADRPTAVCVANDAVAASFIAAAVRAGVRVPEDVSVIGHDDLPVAAYSLVPLTTVTNPVADICRHTAELLCSRLDATYTGPSRTVEVRGRVIVRQSTAPGPAIESSVARTHSNGVVSRRRSCPTLA